MKGLYEPNSECGSNYHAQRMSKFIEKDHVTQGVSRKIYYYSPTDSDESFIAHARIHCACVHS